MILADTYGEGPNVQFFGSVAGWSFGALMIFHLCRLKLEQRSEKEHRFFAFTGPVFIAAIAAIMWELPVPQAIGLALVWMLCGVAGYWDRLREEKRTNEALERERDMDRRRTREREADEAYRKSKPTW